MKRAVPIAIVLLLAAGALGGCAYEKAAPAGDAAGEAPQGSTGGAETSPAAGAGTTAGASSTASSGTANKGIANSTWRIAWDPVQVFAGEPVTFRLDGDPVPAYASLAWEAGGKQGAGANPVFSFAAGAVPVKVRVYGPDSVAPLSTTLMVHEREHPVPPASSSPPPSGPPAPPDFTFEIDRNTVQFRYIWSQAAHSVQWYFGDGASSTDEAPAHSYRETGTYEVLLLLGDGSSTTEIRHSLRIRDVALGIHAAIQDNVVEFSYDWSAPGAEVAWDFGDGTTSSNPAPVHAFASPGPHTVQLVATAGSIAETADKVVFLSSAPLQIVANVRQNGIQFSYEWAWEADTYAWDFGDGNTSFEAAPFHTYLQAGTHHIELALTTGNVRQTATLELKIQFPVLSINAAVAANEVQFDFDWPLAADSTMWSFGDGTGSSEAAPSHVFPFEQTYDVELTVTNGTITRSVTLRLTIAEVPLELTVEKDRNFVDLNFSWSVPASSVLWEVEGWGKTGVQAPRITFTEMGTYTIRLTVQNESLLFGTVTQTMETTVTIDAIALEIVIIERVGNRVEFGAKWHREPASCFWSFGFGISQSCNPVVEFPYRDEFVVQLEVSAGGQGDVNHTVVRIDLVRFSCPGETVYEPQATYGQGDPFLPDLAWASLKTGFRNVVVFSTPTASVGSLQMFVPGIGTTTWTDPSPRTLHVFIVTDIPEGVDVCFRAFTGPDGTGVASNLHAMQARNAMRAWDRLDDTYVVNLLGISNEGASADAIDAGLDIYNDKLFESGDGYLRSGAVILIQNYADVYDGGDSFCAAHSMLVAAGAGQVECSDLFDVVFAYDVDPRYAASAAATAHLDGIQTTNGRIWMNMLFEAPPDSTAAAGHEVGSVLLHEVGHYAFGMNDQYTAQGQGPDCTNETLRLSIMGGSRNATEFDDEVNRCPNEDVIADYVPSWTSLRARYPMIPDRTVAALGPGGAAGGLALRFDAGSAAPCVSVLLCQ